MFFWLGASSGRMLKVKTKGFHKKLSLQSGLEVFVMKNDFCLGCHCGDYFNQKIER
jgi:hypothetical protein